MEGRMDDTIITDSNVGKRLGSMKKREILQLLYQGKAISITAQITIGRSKKNNIRIDDNLASRNHALVQKIKNTYYIKDLDSTNGTYVNNKQIPRGKYVKLHRRDMLKIGRTEMTIT
jgi:pSer/pThr/pTyr-binding forkhead associated (FHA) protein